MSKGQIKFVPLTASQITRFYACIDMPEDNPEACWRWLASTFKRGYGRWKYDKYTAVRAHRLSYYLHHGVDPGELEVCHICDNPGCCNPRHLFLGTHTDNMRDASKKGRMWTTSQTGETNNSAKLTADQVAEIKRAILGGAFNTSIAARYGVTHSLISRIRRGKAWGDGTPMQERYASTKKRAHQ